MSNELAQLQHQYRILEEKCWSWKNRAEAAESRACTRCAELEAKVAEVQERLDARVKRKASGLGACDGSWRWARAYAASRGKVFELSEAEYCALVARPCGYCGCVLANKGMRLDRLNSAGGYTRDNVTPCCGPCNAKKGFGLTAEQFRRAISVQSAPRARTWGE